MRFTELLLLVACMSPLLFTNGLQALQPKIKNNILRRDALIPGLLVPLQFCETGFNICGNIFCCPPDWNCCPGLSLYLLNLSSSLILELNFRRRQLLPTNVSSFGSKFQWSGVDLAIDHTVSLQAMGSLDVVPTEPLVMDQYRRRLRLHVSLCIPGP